MGVARDSSDPAEALARARRVHRACEQFESLWREGRARRLEESIAEAPPGDREGLFAELLALEIELRRESRERPSPQEYRERFPQFQPQVEAAFRSPGGGPRAGESTVQWDHSDCFADTSGGEGMPNRIGGRNGKECPERLGDYELLEEIARGGMGVVYKGRHVALKRVVAVKMILSGAMATPEERARFRREAEAAANLDHPNIVPIYEVRDHDGILYFSMKLIDGGSLAQCTPEFRDAPRRVARLLVSIARAVDFAHGKGFIHCDLKPSNILIDRSGQPQITDFGLARRAAGESSLTVSGAVMGTPSYMAPEQASGHRESIGPGTDVYGLGAILYELLTGQPPFRASSMMETVVQVLERDPVPPRERAPGLPRELETICLKCLEKLPEDRYATPLELAEDLERFLHGEVVEATGTFQRLRRWTRREPEVVSRVGGLALMAVCSELNHRLFSPNRNLWVHYKVQGTLLLWALSALLFQFLWRRGWRTDRVRMLWSTADILFLTVALRILNRLESTLLVGYPLMIAASGLWFRVNLVWYTTALAIAGYLVLYCANAFDWGKPFPTWADREELQYPNIYIAALILTGFVIVRQVKRILALGQYYEKRQGD
ncbi:MAG: serine/threonine-protein kinase [Isosphaeraceae bacterium]